MIGRYDQLVIAQAPVIGTPLVGKTLAESGIRETFGLAVVGIWERGTFIIPRPNTVIERTSVLVFAGTEAAVAAYDEVYSFYQICKVAGDPVIIVGGGRVGHAIALRFQKADIPYLIIERAKKRSEEDEHFVFGDAADIHTLQKAWFEKAPAALITSHDDATNIYLTKYLRSLRPDMQILSRASEDRNVSTLHRAGADFVMSYASLGANAIFNFLMNEETMFLAEGLNFFHLPAPRSLIGKALAQSGIREKPGALWSPFSTGAKPSSTRSRRTPSTRTTSSFSSALTTRRAPFWGNFPPDLQLTPRVFIRRVMDCSAGEQTIKNPQPPCNDV